MAFINIADASFVTNAKTIFNGNLEEWYVNLRLVRKDISRAVTDFVNNRKELLVLTPKETADNMEEERFIDVDQEQVFLVMNVNSWVRTAQETLDIYNNYDRDMLGRVADYVDRCRIIVNSQPFFTTINDERRRNSVFLTMDEIVPSRSDEKIEKRKRVKDSNKSHQESKQRAMDKSTAFTSDSLNECMSEINVARMVGIMAKNNPMKREDHL